MSIKLKIVKTKQFETANKEKHTHYSAAYKGQIFGVSTLHFDADALVVDKETLTVNGDVEVRPNTVVDQVTGETVKYLGIFPKFDLAINTTLQS